MNSAEYLTIIFLHAEISGSTFWPVFCLETKLSTCLNFKVLRHHHTFTLLF